MFFHHAVVIVVVVVVVSSLGEVYYTLVHSHVTDKWLHMHGKLSLKR